MIEADGTLRAGPLTAAMGLLSRRSELEAISLSRSPRSISRIESLSRRAHRTATRRPRRWKKSRTPLRNAIYQSNTAKVELTSSIAQIGDKQIVASAASSRCSIASWQVLLDQVGRLKIEEDHADRAAAAARSRAGRPPAAGRTR